MGGIYQTSQCCEFLFTLKWSTVLQTFVFKWFTINHFQITLITIVIIYILPKKSSQSILDLKTGRVFQTFQRMFFYVNINLVEKSSHFYFKNHTPLMIQLKTNEIILTSLKLTTFDSIRVYFSLSVPFFVKHKT